MAIPPALLIPGLIQGMFPASVAQRVAGLAMQTMRDRMRQLGMSPVASSQTAVEAGAIDSVARGAFIKIVHLADAVHIVAPASSKQVIGLLESAMTKVSQAVSALPQANLSTDDGLAKMAPLLNEAEHAFDTAGVAAQQALDQMSGWHAQIVDIHANVLSKLDQQLAKLKTDCQADIDDNLKQYRLAKTELTHEQTVETNLEKTTKTLQDKINDTQKTHDTIATVLDVFTLGIDRAVTGGQPLDPQHLEDQINNMRKQLQAAQADESKAQSLVIVLEYQMSQRRDQMMFIEKLSGDVPNLLARVTRAKDTSIAAQQQLVDLKDKASALVRQVQTLSNTTRNTSDLAVVVDEFLGGFLTICQQVLIDPQLMDEVNVVTGEIDKSFKLNAQLQQTRSQITATMASMDTAQVIRKIEDGFIVGPLGLPAVPYPALVSSPTALLDQLPTGPLGLPVVAAAKPAADATSAPAAPTPAAPAPAAPAPVVLPNVVSNAVRVSPAFVSQASVRPAMAAVDMAHPAQLSATPVLPTAAPAAKVQAAMATVPLAFASLAEAQRKLVMAQKAFEALKIAQKK